MFFCCCFRSGKSPSPHAEYLSSPPLLSSLSSASLFASLYFLLISLHSASSSNLKKKRYETEGAKNIVGINSKIPFKPKCQVCKVISVWHKYGGWSGGAMVLGNFQYRGVLL